MLLNRITDEEYKMIDFYRMTFAGVNPNKGVPAKELLSVWETNKEKFLGSIFKHSLTLEKPVEVVAPEEQLETEMYDILLKNKNCDINSDEYKAANFISKMQSALYLLIKNLKYDDNEYAMIASIIESFYSTNLVKNKLYKGRFIGFPNVSVKISHNRKSTTISTNMKLTKILGKVNQLLEIPGFEEFLTVRSRILNTSKLRGTLCISIHPLDFLTMSDNDCDWSSCMSWYNEGEYRQGTVEMMNSPCIVVGYLKSSKPMLIDDNEWNNKKYRSLYYVSKDIITNIKGYPYKSIALDKEVVTWLKRLVENYNENCKYQDRIINLNSEDNDYIFEPNTDMMYNDCIGCKDNEIRHIAYISKDKKSNVFDFCYSGPNQCMQCGETFAHFYNESSLICEECDTKCRCEYCEDIFDEEDITIVNGMQICPYCYEEETFEDEITKERFFNSSRVNIYIIDFETGEPFKILKVHTNTAQEFNIHINEYLAELTTQELQRIFYYMDIPYNKITQKGWEFLFPDKKDREEIINICKNYIRVKKGDIL